jgi:hypothetical protein
MGVRTLMTSIPMISVRKLFELMERVREAYKRGGVKEALNVRGLLTPHEVLRICAEEKLKKAGYRIVSRDEAPDFIKKVGSPDIIAEKNGSWVLIEVKSLDQLVRYEQAGVKLILVTNLEKGKGVEIWGIEELDSN